MSTCVQMWVIAATLLYYTERDRVSDDLGNHFQSIPLSMFPTLLMLTGEYPMSDFSPLGASFQRSLPCWRWRSSLSVPRLVHNVVGAGALSCVRMAARCNLCCSTTSAVQSPD